jgi:hypothetical protein
MLIYCGKPPPPHTLDRGPRSLPQVDERGGRGRQVAKSRLPALIVGWRSDGRGSFLGLAFFLGWWPLLFSLEWWSCFLVWGVWFPNHLPLEGTNRIQNFGLYPVARGTQGIYPDSSPRALC